MTNNQNDNLLKKSDLFNGINSDFIADVGKELGMPSHRVRDVWNSFEDLILDCVADGNNFKLGKIGSIRLHLSKPRKVRKNFQTNEMMTLPERTDVRMIFSDNAKSAAQDALEIVKNRK